MLAPGLWSLAAVSVFVVFASAGLMTDEQALTLFLTAGLLGAALGTIRYARLVQLVIVSLVPAALMVLAVFAWIPGAVFPVPIAVVLGGLSAFGLCIGRPQLAPVKPAMSALVGASAIALIAIGVGVVTSFGLALGITLAAVAAFGWVIAYSLAPHRPQRKRADMQPVELLQAALIAAGSGGWAVLSVVIAGQTGVAGDVAASQTPAMSVGALLAVAALGSGFGAALAHLMLRQGMRMLLPATLVIALIGMATVMVAQPGGLSIFVLIGGFIGAFGLAATVTTKRSAPAPEPAPVANDTAAIAQRLLYGDAVLERFALPAIIAAAALGTLVIGLLGTVVVERDAIMASLAAVAAGAVWIAARRRLVTEA